MDSDNTMASALKRKRASVEVIENLKRTKSAKNQPTNSLRQSDKSSAWDAAFNPPTIDRSIPTNGVNGKVGNGGSDSPEAIDFDDFWDKEIQTSALEEEEPVNSIDDPSRKDAQMQPNDESENLEAIGRTPQKKGSTGQALQKRLSKVTKKKAIELWKISEPIGGRLINVDPVFTVDEKFLIVANRKVIRVYSTSNSLLTRSIKLDLKEPASRIVAFSLSPTQSDILWVACSDSKIFRVDWTTGLGAGQTWGVSSSQCVHMTVASMESAGRRRDVVFTTEIRKDGGFRVAANELSMPDSGIDNAARTIYTSTEVISFLKTSKDGSVIVGSSGKRILVGRLRSTEYNTIDKIRYEFRIFETTDPIRSLDLRLSDRTRIEAEGLKKNLRKTPIVDVVVGDVRGVVFVHNDMMVKLFADGTLPSGLSIMPRKLHWHRQAVNTVKWSLDGNYIISGGFETVLVLWQLDTGKQQFLPHMSATILNVVISPTGSSYAVQLADNSAMVLSTAELQPTANISGIQISYLEPEASLESRVQRVEENTWSTPLVQRTPAVINPAQSHQLLIGVGQTQEIKAAKPQKMSNPFLETFDLRVGHNISRQALARTNITNVDAAPSAYRFTEPRVTHISISHDGHWLATVDEWTPPAGDFEHMEHSTLSTFQEPRHRREIFLKFWQRNNQNETWELISRINAPHKFGTGAGPELGDAGSILDLTADPSSLRFATIGEDGVIRTWIPRTRIRDGITVQDKDKRPLQNWFCQHTISPRKLDVVDLRNPRDGIPNTGLLTFSDDGSVLISGCSNDEGCLHLIDPDSGVIRKTHLELFDKEIFGLKIVGQDLVIVSETLVVFDLVSQEKRFELNLNASVSSLSIQQKQEMIHLAVDEQSQTFALALPSYSSTAFKGAEQNMLHLASELVVFSLDSSEPQVKEVFPSVISALIPAVSSEGYLVLDTNAEIYTVVKKGAQAVTILAQSTSALQLDALPEEQASEPAGDLVQLIQDMEDSDSIPEESGLLLKPENSLKNVVKANHDDEGVVTQQQLAQIFDIGPAFALPPIEDMFYQVAGLFSSKPIVS